MRARFALVASLLLAAAKAGPEPPVFGTQAEIVTVDVVVLDADGKPVPGLTRADFVVKEDGRAQAVTAFEVVEARISAMVAPEPTPSGPSAARVATNVSGPPTRRTFAFVFDDLHVGDLDIEQARRAVEAFVTHEARSGDRIVLFTVSDARFWASTRGAADDTFVGALRRVRSHRLPEGDPGCRITHYEAMRMEDYNDAVVAAMVARRLCALCAERRLVCDAAAAVRGATPTADASGEQGSTHSTVAAHAYSTARGDLAKSLRVLREIIRSLEPTPGRKSVVFVTQGFPVDPSLDVFREVREQAARANVALTFLDARGLPVGPAFLSAAGGTAAIPGPDIGPTMALWRLNEEGPKTLALETGGLVLQTNDLVSGLQQVADEARVTYLLGYEPTNDRRDGRYRKLKVEVTRPGLTVRARAGYFAGKGKTKPTPEPTAVDRALRNPFDADGIPLRLAAYVMGPAPLQSPVPKTGVEVLIAGEIRLDALATRTRDGRSLAEPKLTLLASSRAGESHESRWTLEIELARSVEGATPAQAWHPFLTRIAMAPGDHRARLVAESGGKVGSVTVDFDVPGFAEERLSTPILSDRLVERPSGRGVMPVVRREFDRGTTLQCWLELHGAAKDDATGLARATAAFVARSSDGREWASGAAVEMKDEAGRLVRLVSLPLADAPLGESEIVLTVRDEVSRGRFEAREPFRVVPAEAPPPAVDARPIEP